MKIAGFIFSLLLSSSVFSQVGIGNTDPKAKLDVSATAPDNPLPNEGVLVPRINGFSNVDPGTPQDGMLVFLTSDTIYEHPINGNTTYQRGLYYWSATQSNWIPLKNATDKDFFVVNTTENPTSIDDNVFREGSISIGEASNKGQINSIVTTSNQNLTAKPRIGLYVRNSHPSTGASYLTYGIDVINESSVNGNTFGIRNKNSTSTSNTKYGFYNQVTAPGTGIHIGFYNETNQPSTSTNDMFGIQNIVGRTHGATSNNFGIYSEIGSTTSAGNIYGIYSKAIGNSFANVFAGYFLGKVSIGTTELDNYIFPSSRGNSGEIMVAADNGELQWQTATTRNFTAVDSNSGPFIITPEMSTIRISGTVDQIILPDPMQLPGKVFTLIGAPNITTTEIEVNNSATVWDDVTETSIDEIHANERYSIQSNSTNWIVIGK